MKPQPTVSQVITKYRLLDSATRNPMTLREMAEQLTKAVQQDGHNISHQTIANWEQGTYVPHRSTVLSLMNTTKVGDWRYDMAMELLKALDERVQTWN